MGVLVEEAEVLGEQGQLDKGEGQDIIGVDPVVGLLFLIVSVLYILADDGIHNSQVNAGWTDLDKLDDPLFTKHDKVLAQAMIDHYEVDLLATMVFFFFSLPPVGDLSLQIAQARCL